MLLMKEGVPQSCCEEIDQEYYQRPSIHAISEELCGPISRDEQPEREREIQDSIEHVFVIAEACGSASALS